jgi:hypothetical protein
MFFCWSRKDVGIESIVKCISLTSLTLDGCRCLSDACVASISRVCTVCSISNGSRIVVHCKIFDSIGALPWPTKQWDQLQQIVPMCACWASKIYQGEYFDVELNSVQPHDWCCGYHCKPLIEFERAGSLLVSQCKWQGCGYHVGAMLEVKQGHVVGMQPSFRLWSCKIDCSWNSNLWQGPILAQGLVRVVT